MAQRLIISKVILRLTSRMIATLHKGSAQTPEHLLLFLQHYYHHCSLRKADPTTAVGNVLTFPCMKCPRNPFLWDSSKAHATTWSLTLASLEKFHSHSKMSLCKKPWMLSETCTALNIAAPRVVLK